MDEEGQASILGEVIRQHFSTSLPLFAFPVCMSLAREVSQPRDHQSRTIPHLTLADRIS